MIKNILLFSLMLVSTIAQADQSEEFASWLQAFKNEALVEGVSEKTIDESINQAQFLPSVIKFDRSQPEFVSTFGSYAYKRVNQESVAKGREMLVKHQKLLTEIETKYDVPKEVLVAFWGLETNYGVSKGNYKLVSALATLAYEGRRASFFKSELLDLMRIIDARHIPIAKLRGSWAGASGHMQFMPSTFMQHGVDVDLDGRINIWHSLPDAFGSAANYLSKMNWRFSEPIAVEVMLPEQFDYSQASLDNRKSVEYWQNLGIHIPLQLNESSHAAIILPQGWQGPAFMVLSNFDVVMHWNRSVNYALSVALLADKIADKNQFNTLSLIDAPALSYNQMWAIQSKLNSKGFNAGKTDGYPGLQTQRAIRQYQQNKGLPADGFASLELYEQLLSE